MNERSYRRSSLAMLVALALCLPALGADPPQEKPISIRFGTIAPAGTPWARQLQQLKKRIDDESNGRLRVRLSLGGIRGSEMKMLSDLRRGTLQGAGLSNGTIATAVTELLVLELPFLLRSPAEADYLIDEVIGRELEQKASAKGIVIAIWAENGWRSIGTRTRAVTSVADAKGLRVRAQETSVNRAFWDALSAKSIEIPLNEVLGALETGIVEGYDQTPIYMAAAGWYTQIKYLTLTEHIYQPAAVVFSKRFLEGLSPELRQIVLKGARAYSLENRQLVREQNMELVNELANEGIEVARLSPEAAAEFEKQTLVVYDRLRNIIGADLIDRVQSALRSYREREAEPNQETGAPADK